MYQFKFKHADMESESRRYRRDDCAWSDPEEIREPVGIFLAGVQKSGTTSMHGYMASHPALAGGIVKESHFFDNEHIDWDFPDYSNFHAFFKKVPSGARAFDATPIYTFWPPALDRISRYNPAARIIILLRDPIERCYSHWAMEFSRGLETLPFERAIRDGRLRLPAISTLQPSWRVFSYVERGFYADQVRRALSLFPPDQLLFVDSAKLRQNHAAVLRRIAEFLELPPFPSLSPRLDHARVAEWRLPQRDVDYLRELFAADVEVTTTLTGLDPGGWLTLRRTGQ